MLAGAAGAESIDVVPLAPHRDRELHRLDRTLLTDRPRRILELADPIEWQLGRIAAPVEEGRRQRSTELGPQGAGPARARLAMGGRWFRAGQIRVL